MAHALTHLDLVYKMIVYPNAKINIGLRVLNKRPDDFHDLETVFYPVPQRDILEVIEGAELKMCQYGIEYPGDPMENLCVKAYRLLKQEFDIPAVEIHLYKKIPVGAGLGGGSSDAAFTLMVLNEMFHLNLSEDRLACYAAQLGSDCPFFIYNQPMLGTGRGEILTPITVDSLKNYEIKLVYPPVFVSTADAYKGIIPRNMRDKSRETSAISQTSAMPLTPQTSANSLAPDSTSLTELLQLPPDKWMGKIENDFEVTVFAKYPQLEQYKMLLYEQGAVYASMSGSGSAMFGVFKRLSNEKKGHPSATMSIPFLCTKT
ncbi:MAG: 4-(cytidine 5'-diphospho)-2-C-methyl-D-erythritol kinase [Bacteroidales bacterium]